MGITLISPTALTNAAAAMVPVSTADAVLPIDFAALLGQQLAEVTSLAGTAAKTVATAADCGSAPVGERKAEDPEQPVTMDATAVMPLILAGIDAAPAKTDKGIKDEGVIEGNAAAHPDRTMSKAIPADLRPTVHADAKSPRDPLPTARRPEPTSAPNTTPPSIQPLATAETAKFAAPLPAEDKPDSFAAALAAQQRPAASETAPPSTGGDHARLTTPVSDPNWSLDLGNRIVWMAHNDQQTAHLSLTPPQLGPLHITISLNGDQATAAFSSPHAEVRQAIEDAMPRLREMLTAEGISLGQANVGTQAQQHRNSPLLQPPASPRLGDDKAILSGISTTGAANSAPVLTQRGRGLVDLFA